MARPLRQPTASRYWYVTDRCHEERLFLRPDPDVLRIVLRALRGAIQATGVEILFFVVMGNHWHLGVYVPDDASLSKFMQLLKTDVACDMNEHLDRRGAFWHGRYSAIPVLDEASLFERMMYTLMNPVKAGLVSEAAEYLGLSSLEANLGIPSACGSVDLPIRLLPQWAELDPEELSIQRAWARNELRRRQQEVKADRVRRGLPRPKPERCARVDPFDRPQQSAWRAAPRCFAATEAAREAFAEITSAFVEAYRWASEAFRSGVLDVMFPARSYPPRLLKPPVEASA